MLKLGQIIKLLEGQPKENQVRFDFCNFVPSGVSSYRGYYEDLAIEFEEKYPYPTVAVVLKMLKDCIGKAFMGYKGGNHTMDSYTWSFTNHFQKIGVLPVLLQEGKFKALR